jgi:hypothetical protein
MHAVPALGKSLKRTCCAGTEATISSASGRLARLCTEHLAGRGNGTVIPEASR